MKLVKAREQNTHWQQNATLHYKRPASPNRFRSDSVILLLLLFSMCFCHLSDLRRQYLWWQCFLFVHALLRAVISNTHTAFQCV